MTEKMLIGSLKDLNIEVSDKQLNQLNQYYELLIEENKKMNLTAITEKEEAYLKHFYDSATLYKIIDLNKIESMIDIGSGAGFPGIVIKILFPNLKITLVDSLNKRIEFLKYIIKELNLKEVEAVHSRIEDYVIENQEKYDLATARAVAKTSILLETSAQCIKVNGYFVAMKASLANENYKNALSKLNFKEIKKESFKLPIEDSERNLILFQKKDKTSKIFPRKYVEIKKKPL